jgi:hypothetical protein
MRKKKPVISNTGRFFCFNSTVSCTYFYSTIFQTIDIGVYVMKIYLQSIDFQVMYHALIIPSPPKLRRDIVTLPSVHPSVASLWKL